jgi:predicted PurR-regulated permease PerM
MRNASMVLGIVGGAISILLGFFLVLCGLMVMYTSTLEYTNATSERMSLEESESQDIEPIIKTIGAIYLGSGIVSVIAGVLGMIGGIIVKKRNMASGVMMIIAAVFSFFNILSMILFILGGIFALIKEPQHVMQPYPSQYPQPSAGSENPLRQ